MGWRNMGYIWKQWLRKLNNFDSIQIIIKGYIIIISFYFKLTQIYTNRYKVPKSMSRGLLLFVSSYDAGNGNKLMLLARHLTHRVPLIESQRVVVLYALDQHL